MNHARLIMFYSNQGWPETTRREKAQGMVEFALVLPILLVLIFGTIEVGRMLFIYSAVASASREAARYGSAAGFGNGGVPRYRDCSGIRSAATRIGSLSGVQNTDTGVSIQYDDGNSAILGSCPVGGTGPALSGLGNRIMVEVEAEYRPFVPLVPLRGFTIQSITNRTIIKDVNVGVAAPPAVPTPDIFFVTTSQTGDENGGDLTIEVRLSNASLVDVSIPFSTAGSATEGGTKDYTLSANPLVIPAGETNRSITVHVNNDPIYEGDETVDVTTGAVQNATWKGPATHTAKIRDDESIPTVSFVPISNNGAENAGEIKIYAQLSGLSSQNVEVGIQVNGGTADQGSDYQVPGSVTIPAESISAEISMTVIDDPIDEEDETVELAMAAVTNASPAGANATIMITDDDNPPFVSFSPASQAAAENVGIMKVSLQLSTASSKTITAQFGLSGTADRGNDYTLASNSVTLLPGQTSAEIAMTVISDGIDEQDETVILTLDGLTNAQAGTPSLHTATILSTLVPPVVSFSSASQSVGENATSITVVAQLNVLWDEDITIPFTVSGMANPLSDYAIPASPLVIPSGSISGTMAITLLDDSIDEYDESLVVTMGTPTHASKGAPDVHTVTIVDNDDPPTVFFTSDMQTVDESVGDISASVSITTTSAKAITVPFSISGSALNGADFTITPANSVLIPAGQSNATILIHILDDQMVGEAEETIELALGSPLEKPPAAFVGSLSKHTIRIAENDQVCPSAPDTGSFRFNSKNFSWNFSSTDPTAVFKLMQVDMNWSPDSRVKLEAINFGSTSLFQSSSTNPAKDPPYFSLINPDGGPIWGPQGFTSMSMIFTLSGNVPKGSTFTVSANFENCNVIQAVFTAFQ